MMLVGLGGFEPPTSPLSGVRSNQLSYRPKVRGATPNIVQGVGYAVSLLRLRLNDLCGNS